MISYIEEELGEVLILCSEKERQNAVMGGGAKGSFLVLMNAGKIFVQNTCTKTNIKTERSYLF